MGYPGDSIMVSLFESVRMMVPPQTLVEEVGKAVEAMVTGGAVTAVRFFSG